MSMCSTGRRERRCRNHCKFVKRFNGLNLKQEVCSPSSARLYLPAGCSEGSVPSAVSMRLERLDPLCMPLTIPAGGRSMAAGRAEEQEVVAVTSGGTETFSKRREKMAIKTYL